MTSKLSSNQSQSKKSNKKNAQPFQQQQMIFNNKKGNKGNNFIGEGQKINFQSEDSQGSDISFESSIQSEEDINIGQIQYFKQQMGRFFINYPELINNEIIQDQQTFFANLNNQNKPFSPGSQAEPMIDSNKNWIQNQFNQNKVQSLNKNWKVIADQILGEAKQSCSFLEALSRRIALYRSKVQQEDLIDVLLKQEKNIMKQIDLEINLRKKEVKGTKNNIQHIQGTQNMYFSWRKKKQMENRLNLQKDVHKDQTLKSPIKNKQKLSSSPNNNKIRNQKSESAFRNKNTSMNNQKNQSQIVRNNVKKGTLFLTGINQSFVLANNGLQNRQINQKSFFKSLQKKESKNFNDATNHHVNRMSTTNHRAYSLGKNGKQAKQLQKQNMKKKQDEEKQNKANQGASVQTFWKHLVNFEPRTEAGRQLCQLIRKTNNPNDQLGIKKTIMTFLSRTKETVQNQIVLKSTISQKIQKLYNDDSKQLLMFYPTKMSSSLGNNGTKSPSNSNKDDNNSQNSNKYSSNIHLNGNGSTNDYIRSQQITSQQQSSRNNNRNPSAIGNNNFNSAFAGLGGNLLDTDSNSHSKLFQEGEKFMTLLEDIVEGPLMRYWMMLQENKL